jgi:methionine sulfoxide reductase heme-binding subunit
MNQALWYASRATGLVSIVLLTSTMVLGLLGAGRLTLSGWPRFAMTSLHRNLSLLAVCFVVVHVATAVIDPYAGLRWVDAVLPFDSPYHAFWVGLGAVALDLMLAMIVTSLLRARIGLRTWRVVHLTAYACWPVAFVHGLGIGGVDSRRMWVLAIDLVCLLTVALALTVRTAATHPDTLARQSAYPLPR